MVNKIPFIKSLIGELKFKFKSCHNLNFSKTKICALGHLKWATHKNYPHNFYTPKIPSFLLFPFLQKKGNKNEKGKRIKQSGEAGMKPTNDPRRAQPTRPAPRPTATARYLAVTTTSSSSFSRRKCRGAGLPPPPPARPRALLFPSIKAAPRRRSVP